ncbi:hypothetical protein [Sphingomonas sp. SUN039]|uniref:hypothetical protein n=1 Tax=Sphingomonas sp. SUN039 TaxID=2937787 RepID=UPI0021640B51|nr:hypothetical protein [Sphingomonas sp. SUN039]UVO54201.1 hypothetical protein M0209_08740 [Sphingomonas sp. SUN039]
MTCESEKSDFENKLSEVQTALNNELASIAISTEQRANEIANDFEADNDLAAGVGAVAGATVGGLLGGPTGVIVGGTIGRAIGSLFTLEITTYRQSVVLDVPQTSLTTRAFSFDLPVVSIHDADLSFDIPTTEMRRQEGPPIPHSRTRMVTHCVGPSWARVCTDLPEVTVEWEPTYIDVPVIVMRTQHIIFGVPSVSMERREIKVDIPEISMQPTSMSVDVPSITLRFIKDAGRRTAALAAALAQSAQQEAAQKQIAFQQRLRSEVAPFALKMFACYREQIMSGRSAAMSQFEPQIATLTAAITSMAGRSVPDSAPEFVAARAELEAAIKARDNGLIEFDNALAKLNVAAQQAMEQFLGHSASSLVEPELLSSGIGSLVAFNSPA